MEIAEAVRKIIKEMVLPELGQIHGEYREIKSILEITNKRLDDMNLQLVEQSRRIDETNKRIDETRTELRGEIGKLNQQENEMILSVARLHQVTVSREEHQELREQVKKIAQSL